MFPSSGQGAECCPPSPTHFPSPSSPLSHFVVLFIIWSSSLGHSNQGLYKPLKVDNGDLTPGFISIPPLGLKVTHGACQRGLQSRYFSRLQKLELVYTATGGGWGANDKMLEVKHRAAVRGRGDCRASSSSQTWRAELCWAVWGSPEIKGRPTAVLTSSLSHFLCTTYSVQTLDCGPSASPELDLQMPTKGRMRGKDLSGCCLVA